MLKKRKHYFLPPGFCSFLLLGGAICVRRPGQAFPDHSRDKSEFHRCVQVAVCGQKNALHYLPRAESQEQQDTRGLWRINGLHFLGQTSNPLPDYAAPALFVDRMSGQRYFEHELRSFTVPAPAIMDLVCLVASWF